MAFLLAFQVKRVPGISPIGGGGTKTIGSSGHAWRCWLEQQEPRTCRQTGSHGCSRMLSPRSTIDGLDGNAPRDPWFNSGGLPAAHPWFHATREYLRALTPHRMSQLLEMGLDTFGDVTVDEQGTPLPQHQVLRNVVAEAELADRLGLDFFGVGEHHRDDFAVSAPEVVLAAIAGCTSRIRLGSAVTVLSSDDPVRVFERFATLDALSNGRAEVIVGRGSFTESFPLFGFKLEQYELLFEERMALFVELLKEGPTTWSGQTRAP